ncbi:MAG: hypothetical protein EHM70_25760 [Chloroflexota bacterium]|nr:MAG: hypothetical protein EHM70_25760 [Chloroflexota bacterium]
MGRFVESQPGRLDLIPWTPGVKEVYFDAHKTRLVLPDGARIPLAGSFSEIPAGEVAAVVGSSGLVEIAANRKTAAEMLGLPGHSLVRLEAD